MKVKVDEEVERLKRLDIAADKQRKQAMLDKRTEVIYRAREIKAAASQEARQRSKEAKLKEEEDIKRARTVAAAILEKELSAKREAHRAEQAALQAEQDRIKRQQQYLGAAMGQVEEMRDHQLQLARERQAAQLARQAKQQADGLAQSLSSDRANKSNLESLERRSKHADVAERDLLVTQEKRVSLEKIKHRVVEKKEMFLVGQKQHEATRTALFEHNPYAISMSDESLTKVRSKRLAAGGSQTLVRAGSTGLGSDSSRQKHVHMAD